MGMSILSKKRFVAAIVTVSVFILLWIVVGGWNFWGPVEVEKTDILMDTSVTVKIFVRNKKHGEQLISEAFDEAKRIESIMEPVNGDGELKRLNSRTRGGWFTLSPELGTVIKTARKYYERSGGAYDPTVAPLKWLWDFENGGRVPSESELAESLRHVGMSRIEIAGDSLRFKGTGMKLDLGAVAKGYAVDRMIDFFQARGIESILVNAGGDIALRGTKPGEKDWVIGLRHPRLNRTIVLSSNPYPAVATSGDYERCFFVNGIRYHHILDPSTGYPARDCASVTVWTNTAMDADILATTIFVLGPQKGIALAETLDDVETCIFYEKDGRLESVVSSGIRDWLSL